MIVLGYRHGYLLGETCEWILRAPNGSRLVVEFLYLDMSECYSHRVTVYDGERGFLRG